MAPSSTLEKPLTAPVAPELERNLGSLALPSPGFLPGLREYALNKIVQSGELIRLDDGRYLNATNYLGTTHLGIYPEKKSAQEGSIRISYQKGKLVSAGEEIQTEKYRGGSPKTNLTPLPNELATGIGDQAIRLAVIALEKLKK